MIVLLGHGYIGQAIKKELEAQQLEHVWLTHKDELPFLRKSIINATGFTGVPNVDACETYKQETIDGNVTFPLMLEQNTMSTPIVHISSGCVYTGYKDGGWTEEDEPNFNFNNGSFYSGAKALEQKVLAKYMRKSYLLRIRMPFSDERTPKNLLTKLEKYDKLIDYENSLSYVPDVAKFAVFCATKFPAYGVYNVCNPGSKTTKQIADMMGLNKEWFSKEEFKDAVVAPRSNCTMNTDKLTKVFPIQDIDTALSNCLKNYK